MQNRNPRTTGTREAEERPTPWKRASMLPTPDPRDGLSFRWIRTASMGNADMTNVSGRFRDGYEPVKAAEYPELRIMSDLDSRFKDNIEVGGLLLCAIPTKTKESRIHGQLETAKNQSEAVDRTYMRDSDPRIPVFSERNSR